MSSQLWIKIYQALKDGGVEIGNVSIPIIERVVAREFSRLKDDNANEENGEFSEPFKAVWNNRPWWPDGKSDKDRALYYFNRGVAHGKRLSAMLSLAGPKERS